MTTVRRFLRPGWILGLLAVMTFTWVCFAFLAPWQLGKSDDLDARNDRLTESVLADPEPLSHVVTGPGDFGDTEWRLVTVTGQWRTGDEALLRLRSVDGEPVYHVLTVFEPTEGGAILVNRGHIPVGENNTVPAYPAPPTGTVDLTSRVRATEAGQAEPVEIDGMPAVRAIDPAILGDVLDQRLEPAGYLQLAADQPGSLAPAPIPAIETGPYLSYGLQWLAFGILAPVALIYFAWSEVRARRRDAEQHTEDRAPDAAGEPPDDAPRTTTLNAQDPASVELDARKRAMRDRYGSRDDAEHRRAYRRADRLRS